MSYIQPLSTKRRVLFGGLLVILANIFMIQPLSAQKRDLEDLEPKYVTFGTDSNRISIPYIEVRDSPRMINLAEILGSDNFPMIVMSLGVFEKGIIVVKDMESVTHLYGNFVEEQKVLSRLNMKQDSVYEHIIQSEKLRVDLYKEANRELNYEIQRMNNQLDQSLDLLDKSLKGRNRKTFTIGLLGGLVGISAGVILGILVSD